MPRLIGPIAAEIPPYLAFVQGPARGRRPLTVAPRDCTTNYKQLRKTVETKVSIQYVPVRGLLSG